MTNAHNPGHVKRSDHRSTPSGRDVNLRDLERDNLLAGAELPGEEPRNVRKAGGGTKGTSMGGAHTGRYGPSPGKVVSNREPKPRGRDKGS